MFHRSRRILKNKEFRAFDGLKCPYCESSNIGGTERFRQTEDGKVLKAGFCLDCNMRWYEVYKLTGWESR